MFRVRSATGLGPDLTRLDIEAPDLARAAQPGQFLMLRIDEEGERIPLTIADSDPDAGTVSVIFLAVGKTTQQLSRLKPRDAVLDVAGPLGRHMEIEKVGTVVCVGGGVGVPALYPKARALKHAGNYVISVIGARTAELLVLVDEMSAISDEVRITTDDGSRGRKGFVSDELKDMLEDTSRGIDLVVAVGPIPMMAAVAETTRPYGVKTLVSLNPIMVDGTGMCGGCRVTVGGETKFACVDGPVFDAHEVNFTELAKRQTRFVDFERRAKEEYEHACRLQQA
ncbi:MAG: sulfide/dihydroorotate dehydrogenase-like FAD/NAD-binding protein [Armatimonadota bacterium]|nr:MAG: sulfide/dihydroorotate dehydrogenase-like FAD/NAD-binding protein [Armatimonadota bacterium]